MSIVGDIKEIAEVVQKADNIQLLRQVLDLQEKALEMLEENRELKEKVRDLDAKLNTQEDVAFKDSAYWKKSDNDGPFCMHCWDDKKKLIRMKDDEGYVSCPNRACGYTYQTEECKRREQAAIDRNRKRGEEYLDRF